VIAAVPERGDPRDALVGATLEGLPVGGRVATGSVRRRAQLAHQRPDLTFAGLRGNIETRLRKAAEFDAAVVAAVALQRLGRSEVIAELLDPSVVVPQVGQGALAVECRVDDMDTEHLLQSIVDDDATRYAVAAERAMLAALEAGCSAPVGALADVVEDFDAEDRVVHRLSLRGVAAANWSADANLEGSAVDLLRASATGDLTEGEQLGRALAAELLELGAGVLSGPEQ
jgi:hydroxymethylbilane synthase